MTIQCGYQSPSSSVVIRTVIFSLFLPFNILLLPWQFLHLGIGIVVHFPPPYSWNWQQTHTHLPHTHTHIPTLLLPAIRPFTERSQPQWLMGMLSWNLSTSDMTNSSPIPPPHTHTLICQSICEYTWVYKFRVYSVLCVFCMHAVKINFFWRGEKLIFSVALCAAL